jgi:hypothetical protein
MSLAAVTRLSVMLRTCGEYEAFRFGGGAVPPVTQAINLNVISILLRHASETRPHTNGSTLATTFSMPFWAYHKLEEKTDETQQFHVVAFRCAGSSGDGSDWSSLNVCTSAVCFPGNASDANRRWWRRGSFPGNASDANRRWWRRGSFPRNASNANRGWRWRGSFPGNASDADRRWWRRGRLPGNASNADRGWRWRG